MSDPAWLVTIVVIVLVFIAGIFVWLWHKGDGNNGLKDELEDRVSTLEAENVTIWQELRRLANRWIP